MVSREMEMPLEQVLRPEIIKNPEDDNKYEYTETEPGYGETEPGYSETDIDNVWGESI